MNTVLKSGFEVVHPSVDQLVVVAHPLYWLLLITIILVVAGLAIGIAGVRKTSGKTIALGLVVVIFGIFMSSLALSRGQVTFDRSSGTVSFERTRSLFRSQHLSFPLGDVRGATVQTMGGGSYHFMVVFKNGGAEDIMGSSGATGQYKAADAVNTFLGVNQARP